MVTNGSTITTTDYDGNYIYTNSALSQILQPEGYIVPNGSTYQYYFQYKDNLSSNRLTYCDFNGDGTISPSEIVEEDNYYPFGLKQQGYNNTHNGTGSKYKYNGKELQDDAVGSYHLNLYDLVPGSMTRLWEGLLRLTRWLKNMRSSRLMFMQQMTQSGLWTSMVWGQVITTIPFPPAVASL